MVYRTNGKLNGLNIELSQTSVNKLLKEIQNGDDVKLDIEIIGQSFIQLQTYFCRIKEVLSLINNEDVLKTFYNLLLEDLIINSQIDKDILHIFIKKIIGKPSFSFSNLPSWKKRNEFVNQAFDLMDRWKYILSDDYK